MTKPILVTGAHRSGTTWTGRMLAEAPGVFYMHEPFSLSDAPGSGICGARMRYWFTHITRENESSYYRAIRNSLSFRYNWLGALRSVGSVADARRVIAEGRAFRAWRRRPGALLIKDPNALFSAEWLADRFDVRVVVMVRHPAAFVSSVKMLNWSHPFSHFLAQPGLMQAFLAPFEEEIRDYARCEHAVFDQAILLWRLIYHSVSLLQARHRDWIYLRHEDLSRDPVGGFERLYDRLELPFTEAARQAIAVYSGAHNPAQPAQHIGADSALKRDSAANIHNWRQRLSTGEIAQIRDRVEPLASRFYGEEDW